MPEVIKTMEILKDRFVTPTFHLNPHYRNLGVMVPTLDDASAIYVDFAPRHHHFNYPARHGGYAANGILSEFLMEGTAAIGATPTYIEDEVTGMRLASAGNPVAEAAGIAGLGQGLAFDGTADLFNLAHASIKQDWLTNFRAGDFTIEAVIKGTNANNTLTALALRDGAAGEGFSLQTDGSENMDFTVEDQAGTTKSVAGDIDGCTGSNIVWHAICDRSGDNTISLYGDNVLSGAAVDLTSSMGKINPIAGTFTVGAQSGAGAAWVGSISFIRIYNRVLGATERT